MRLRDENKEQLVKQKALELLVNQGFEGFSMQKLAKAAKVSPATLYIYYKDKEDLIMSIGKEVGEQFNKEIFKDFDPTAPFKEGLRIQWRNRANYAINHPLETAFYEQIKSSTFREAIAADLTAEFKEKMSSYMKNAINNKEVKQLPIEVYWSIAYAPLYNLLRFNKEGKSMAGFPFSLSEEMLWQTFDLVVEVLVP